MKERKKPHSDSGNNGNPQPNCPQPFIVKMDKGKSWSKAEIISLTAMIITISGFFMTVVTFRNTVKQANIANEPFIEIGIPFFYYPFRTDTLNRIDITFNNYGNYPVKIKDISLGIVPQFNPPDTTIIFEKITKQTRQLNNYIVKGSPLILNQLDKPYSIEEINAFMSGKVRMYFFGYIIYTNLTNNKNKQYKFIIKKISKAMRLLIY